MLQTTGNCIPRRMTGIWGLIFAIMMLTSLIAPLAQAVENPQKSDNAQVMEAFERQATRIEDSNVLNDHKKHIVMFLLGVPLLILLLITGALGIAMAIYGKQVFVMHMVFAGLTITLAFVHVIVGLVWFYPF